MNNIVQDVSRGSCFYCGAIFALGDLITTCIPSQRLVRNALWGSVVYVQICKPCAARADENADYLSTFLCEAVSRVPDLAQKTSSGMRHTDDSAIFTREEQLLVTAHYEGLPDFTQAPAFERILSVIVKNARAHAFKELGQVLEGWPETLIVQSLPKATDSWIASFLHIDHTRTWPHAGSRLMVRMFTGENMRFGWITVAPGAYVYAVFEDGSVTVRSIIREYLLTEVSWGGGCGATLGSRISV